MLELTLHWSLLNEWYTPASIHLQIWIFFAMVVKSGFYLFLAILRFCKPTPWNWLTMKTLRQLPNPRFPALDPRVVIGSSSCILSFTETDLLSFKTSHAELVQECWDTKEVRRKYVYPLFFFFHHRLFFLLHQWFSFSVFIISFHEEANFSFLTLQK
mgnify:CR=1 FL=1